MKTRAAQTSRGSFTLAAPGWLPIVVAFFTWWAPTPALLAQPTKGGAAGVPIEIREVEGKVEVLRTGAAVWDPAYPNQVLQAGDRLRTRPSSRATLRWSDQSTVRLGERSEIEILKAQPKPKAQTGFNLFTGVLYFFHRDKPADLRFNTRTATAAIRGTEFDVRVEDNGRTLLTMLDGEVELSNAAGQVLLQSGEQGLAEPGKAPSKTAVISAINVIQWCLYYPAVLDVSELPLDAQEEQLLADSLAAYRAGDVLQALAKYPADRQPAGAAEKVYLGAVLLAVGQVEQAEALFASLSPATTTGERAATVRALAAALRQLIAAVKLQPWERTGEPRFATEWLAESYHLQSRAHLNAALAAARKAVAAAPNFGFGWARVAELEFSFGHTDQALAALEKSLGLAPRNAEAVALKGFLLSAQNRIAEAIAQFEQALALDGALGNAWLGRGLCRIRQGQSEAGRADLLVAATLEPQRALLRSYLGKAYSNAGDNERAQEELRLARKLDQKDPTAWLYSALLLQQQNRINEAVRDLEQSQELNDNRRLYRSRLLLDQDRAVRAANLANIYRDAGMFDVSVREASRAVNADYANYSAHLFLASSYDQFRDPKQINLRFETPAETEYLIANLLAPVGAGTLSQRISQQEYSKLFERDRFGLFSSTEYFSNGDWLQSGVHYGTSGNTSYAVEAFYRADNGQRPNNDFEQRWLSLQLKQQITPADAVYLKVSHYDAEGGDLYQRYDPTSANPGLRTRERQEPFLTLGYHHEWSPGVHTLLLAGRLDDTYWVNDPQETILIAAKSGGDITAVRPITIQQNYRSTLTLYSVEAQQIFQHGRHTTTLGARGQWGEFDIDNFQDHPDSLGGFFYEPAVDQHFDLGLERYGVYGYHKWELLDSLWLIGGVSYERVQFPDNFRAAPLSPGEDSEAEVSPKAGLIWLPAPNTIVRAAYTRSLSGASLEQSYQIEPTHVGGFNQSFRSIIPESVAGANAGARFETYGVSLEQRFPTGTYVAVTGELLNSEVQRVVGNFSLDIDVSDYVFIEGLREHLDYKERALQVTFDQLLGAEWSLGARYRLSHARLVDRFPEVPGPDIATLHAPFAQWQQVEAVLHQLSLHTIFNHRSGFFGQLQALWHLQSNHGYEPDLPGDEFWQLNLFAGYRFPRRIAELRVGLLNLTDQDYRLNPLTLYNELPHERMFVTRLQFNF